MLSDMSKLLAPLILMAALSACETAPETPVAEGGPAILVEGVTSPTNMMFVGADIEDTPSGLQLQRYAPQGLSANEGALKGIATKIDPTLDSTESIGNMVSAIRSKTGAGQAPPAPQGMQGIGGIPARVLLEVAKNMAQNPGGKYSPRWRVDVIETRGQILGYEIGGIHGGGAATDPGRMVVETWTTWQLRNPGGQPVGPEQTERYKFTAEVEGGFQVKPRAANPDPHDIFPGTGLHIPLAGNENFKFKIYSRGQGIQVTEVAYDENGNGTFEANEIVTPGSTGEDWHDELQSIFLPHEDSCIDMMVQEDENLPYFVPRDYAELQTLGGPPKYCLGRCENPPLINTK